MKTPTLSEEKAGVLDQRRDSTPVEPNAGTQARRLLTALQTGQAIDPLTAWAKFGIYRTSDVIFRLRRAGWKIRTERKDVSNQFGELCHVALYRLE